MIIFYQICNIIVQFLGLYYYALPYILNVSSAYKASIDEKLTAIDNSQLANAWESLFIHNQSAQKKVMHSRATYQQAQNNYKKKCAASLKFTEKLYEEAIQICETSQIHRIIKDFYAQLKIDIIKKYRPAMQSNDKAKR